MTQWINPVTRKDGISILPTEGGFYEVVPNDARAIISHCPCCAKPFASARSARLIADQVYPYEEPKVQ